MGREKSTVQKDERQTTGVNATQEETELNKLALERARAAQGGLIESQGAGLSLINQLLAGEDLPGFLQSLPGGISPEAIGQEASTLARQNLTGFQNIGLENSGVAFRETAKDIANRILFPSEQFNIGNIQNLLNLALSGQAQVQQPILGSEAGLGGRLAGLRGITRTGTGMQSSFGMNPFAKSFQTSFGGGLGSTLGKPKFSALGGALQFGG